MIKKYLERKRVKYGCPWCEVGWDVMAIGVVALVCWFAVHILL